MPVRIQTFAMANPGDFSDFERRLRGLDRRRVRRLAVVGKTEGNADTNDYSRELAMLGARLAIERVGGEALMRRATVLFSTGCEGAYTPFGYVLVSLDGDGRGGGARGPARLAMGVATTRRLEAGEVGTPRHAHLLADAVTRAMRGARVTRDQVALVIVKSPVMRLEPAVRQRRSAAGPRITSGHAKAVGGLGVGIALGEVSRRAVTQERIGADHSLYCRRGMVFSGSEVDYCEVVVLGNRPGAGGDLVIHSAQIADVLDAASIRRLLLQAGCRLDAVGGVRDADRVVASFMKVGLAPDGRLRGRRTAILNSHLDVDKHLRATATGVVGSILGTTATFISAGALHQAPPGGGLYACVVRDGSGSRR